MSRTGNHALRREWQEAIDDHEYRYELDVAVRALRRIASGEGHAWEIADCALTTIGAGTKPDTSPPPYPYHVP